MKESVRDLRLFFPGTYYRFFSVQLITPLPPPEVLKNSRFFLDYTYIAQGIFLREVLEASAGLAAPVMLIVCVVMVLISKKSILFG